MFESESIDFLPSTRFASNPFPSCWLASPALPRSGSSSVVSRLLGAGLDSGMPVAEAMVCAVGQGDDKKGIGDRATGSQIETKRRHIKRSALRGKIEEG